MVFGPAMLIICPTCQTSYDIEATRLGPHGRAVRCAKCGTGWSVGGMPAAAPAEAVSEAFPQSGEPSGAAFAPAASTHAEAAESDVAWGVSEPDSVPGADQPPHTDDAPPLVPEAAGEATPADEAPAEPEDIETAAARHARLAVEPAPRAQAQRLSWLALLVGLAATAAALCGWRHEVVRLLPQTARAYAAIGLPVNLRGVVFEEIRTREETVEGVPVLVVQGNIVNVTARTVEVPRLRFALRNAAGIEVYAWTALPASPSLAAGAVLPFRSNLASPPEQAHDVQVRFFNRRDVEPARP